MPSTPAPQRSQAWLQRRREAMAKPWIPTMLRYASRAHVGVYRATGGRVGGYFRLGAGFRKPVHLLLLDHVGRRSGTTLSTPLLYLEDGLDLVVVASQGGRPEDPQWYRNLRATPSTQVQVGSEVRRVLARTATDDERERLWPRLVAMYADFATYQAITDRVIPVVVLEPR